ncbi:helix-turn-helix domain-containing protein [Botrimarina sp.]|uniref:helix-turn-helix domain-containing protein n=1 Tax=Botrimarina sp. TaxID=2795802 RepID=UPI0032EC915A
MVIQPKKPPAADDDVLTLAETAELLKVSERTAAKLVKSGDLPARRVRGQWRLLRPLVLAYIAGDTLPAATYRGEPGSAIDTFAAASGADAECREYEANRRTPDSAAEA